MNEIMNFTSVKDAMEWATIISKSKFCPKEFFNLPESVLVAIAYGAELGLKPLQSLQNIAVINGKPSIYGDAMLAVCKNSPDFEYITELCEVEVAVCKVKRKGQPEVHVTFSKQDAINAGLWSRPGPWKQYPNRMLQMRARSFALRDCFPDVLKGMIAVEEAQDYQVKSDVPIAEKPRDAHMPIEYLSPIKRLNKLIFDKGISTEQVNWWLSKAGVVSLDLLPDDRLEKLINHIEQEKPGE